MSDWAWLLPTLPAAAAVIGLFAWRLIPGGPATPAILGTTASVVVAVGVLASAEHHPLQATSHTTSWTPTGTVSLHVGTRVDGLAAVVALMVAIVALAVQVYSTSYMAGDPRYASYAAEISLFTAAMLLVVVASDLFELLIGWEVMGLCSYLLVGHYWQTEGARAAAVKALITTRIGDTAFLFGIFALGLGAGSFDIGRVTAAAPMLPHATVVAGAVLLLGGVVGKSAQFPLHVWLPDAMAGPTPVSALIHAATMVAAGIYVVARVYPVFLAAPIALTVLGIIACITMLGAALAALAEDDLKRVLAWSTVSQLAYMAAGLAVRGWSAGIWHLLTHAAFKALLFLAAGSVLRTLGTNLMSEMGGLWRRMPVTFVTAVVGAAALAGVPPFAGAFSKDAVLAAAREHGGGLGDAVYVVGLVTVFVTGAYVTRLVVRTFLGSYRGDPAVRLHESPVVMTGPLVVLATFAVLLGAPVLPASYGVQRWLGTPAGTLALHVGVTGVLVTALTSIAAIALVAWLWARRPAADPIEVLGRAAVPLRRAFFVDEVYDTVVVRPVRALARATLGVDRHGIDATAVGSGRAAVLLGGGLRRLQTGNVQTYLSVLVAGVLIVVLSVSVAVAT
ncbi:MAG TPA: NADH-quinone oxidoreductase subunit L [Mycobacteriales bacterium]|nr:NADH-quinone oxidoreductase subunit L [Mycobacteriales bacterium]